MEGATRGSGVTLNATCAASVYPSALTRVRPVAVYGEPPALQKLRKDLQGGLWGQPEAEEGFVRLHKDTLSPARRTPPVLAIAGDVGHGKDQALAAYGRSVFGEGHRVVSVDLHDVLDRDFGVMF